MSAAAVDRATAGHPYLGQDNEAELTRLVGALDLAEGFALFFVWVPDSVTSGLLVERLQQTFGSADLRVVDVANGGEPWLPWLFEVARPTSPTEIIVFTRWGHPTLDPFALAGLNKHRNEWIDRVPCRHLFVLSGEVRRLISLQAADVYDVRAGDFYFALPSTQDARATATGTARAGPRPSPQKRTWPRPSPCIARCGTTSASPTCF